jgi:hypothetical protein
MYFGTFNPPILGKIFEAALLPAQSHTSVPARDAEQGGREPTLGVWQWRMARWRGLNGGRLKSFMN